MKLLQFHFISHPHGRHFVCSIFLRWLTLVFPLNHLHVSSSHYIVPRLMEECHSFDAATFTMCRVPNLDYVVFLWCSAPQHIDHCLIGPLYYLRHYFPINLSDRVSSMLLHFFFWHLTSFSFQILQLLSWMQVHPHCRFLCLKFNLTMLIVCVATLELLLYCRK